MLTRLPLPARLTRSWNHQGWQGAEKGRWLDVHTTMFEKKWFQGMEIANGDEYYPDAHRWCLEKNLTMLGNMETRRRRKLVVGDVVQVDGKAYRPITYTSRVNFSTNRARPSMPRKSKIAEPETTNVEPETNPVEAAPELPRGAKAQAIRDALKANPGKEPREIVALLREQGLEVTNAAVSMAKFNMQAKRRKNAKAAAAPAPEAAATPAVPKDAISIGLLQKAKKLAKELGGIKEAKAAIDALAQILD